LARGEDCEVTEMRWGELKSCAPVVKTEIKCADKKGAFWPVPAIIGTKLSISVKNSFFSTSPFNLLKGDSLVCKVRATNDNGSSKWSNVNQHYRLSVCGNTTLSVKNIESPCKCQSTCKVTGCAKCCGPSADKLTLGHVHEQHRHEFCHVHVQDQNRTIQKTVWKEMPVMMKKIVIRPINVTR